MTTTTPQHAGCFLTNKKAEKNFRLLVYFSVDDYIRDVESVEK